MAFLKTADLFDLTHTLAAPLLSACEYPFQALPKIHDFVSDLIPTLPENYVEMFPGVWVEQTAKIASTACIKGPAVICAGAEIRHGAYIRGNALIGANAVVGNSTEIKNAILFDNVQVPHYNYVGDSILGYKAHMGAGALASNVRSDKKNITIHVENQHMDTGMHKIGAMLGDYVEVGCNSVLCPGTVVGRNTNIYPLSRVRGTVPENMIYKDSNHIVPKRMD